MTARQVPVRAVEGFMCSTDWEEELGEAPGGVRVFRSEADLRKHRDCVDDKDPDACHVVRVTVTITPETKP